MKKQKRLFTPLGIDYLAIACDDNLLWSRALERFGFIRIRTELSDANDCDAYFGIAMALDNARIFLVDSQTKRFGNGSISQFLRCYGNMQVVEVGIRVDSIRRAYEECAERLLLTPQLYYGDTFGDCAAAQFDFSPLASFQHTFVERRDVYYGGIDHLAIAVRHIDRWVEHYQSFWGFETVYTPHGRKEGLIEGKESAMRTFALRRGGWTVALVEGVDRERTSQVTTYTETHGDHSPHHAALLCRNLENTVESLLAKGVQFRLSKPLSSPSESLTAHHIIHRGEDYGGPLLQCFTKPFDRKEGKGGFFFELIERSLSGKRRKGKQAFYDFTVGGLLESIEREIKAGDSGCIFVSSSSSR